MKQGFTLIELLVVVLIIGILAAIALPQYTKAVEKARAAEGIQLLGDLATAEQIYHMTTGSFTTDLTLLDIELPNATAGSATTNNFKVAVVGANGTAFTAYASRTKGTAYNLNTFVGSNGTIVRWCSATAGTATAIAPNINGTTSEICKAISNNASGTIK